MKRKRGQWIWGISTALCFSACAATPPPASPTPAFVAWGHDPTSEKRICVLPFTAQTGREETAEQVRRRFAGHLSVKRFSDVELYELDARLHQLSEHWRTLPPSRLGETLGCEALVFGELLHTRRVYLGLYSQLALTGAIRLVDAKSGTVLVETARTTTAHSGGMVFSPIGMVVSAVSSLRNMSEAQMTKAADDLGRTLADAIPDLAETASVQHAAAPPEAASERYQVQVAAFRSSDQARQTQRLLQQQGYTLVAVRLANQERAWHRVVIGPFASQNEAQEVQRRIQTSLPFSPLITTESSR